MSLRVAVVGGEVSELVAGEPSPVRLTRGFEQVACLLDHRFGAARVAAAPGEEAAEVELHGRAAGRIGIHLHELLDVAHRADRGPHRLVRPVIDDPVGLPRECVENVEPAAVTRRQDDEQGVEQGERLVMLLAGLGLPQRLAQRLDRFGVPDVGGADEVPGGGAVVTLRNEHPGDEAVQAPAGAPRRSARRSLPGSTGGRSRS